MEFQRCFSLFALIIVTSMYYQCKVLANQDLFFKVDGTEELLPIFEEDAPDDFCIDPPVPSNGEMICGKLKTLTRRYVCIARCDSGFEFPNKEKAGKIACNLITGNWLTSSEFPDCEKQRSCTPRCKNGGTCLDENICSCTPEFQGDRCEKAACSPPCQNEGTCAAGNECICAPDFEGDRCESAVCNPPCQNGGSCVEGNICLCTPDFEGDRCNIGCADGWTEYFNTDSPLFSDLGDDESLARIREFEPVCAEGFISAVECKAIVNGRLVDYKKVGTVGLKCSKETGFTCDKQARGECEDFAVRFFCECGACKTPPVPRNGKMWCSKTDSDPKMQTCSAECDEGYKFPDGEETLKHTCDSRTQKWTPDYEFPDCEEKKPEVCVDGWTDYINTDSPEFSDIGDDESLDRIRKIEPFCVGGIIKDIECNAIVNGMHLEYKRVGTHGLKCSKDTGFVCDRKVRRKKCEDFEVAFLCECAVCNPPCQNGGSCAARNQCVCTPDFKGDRCENVVCKPSCKNGGICGGGNQCFCPLEFEGDRCENAVCNPPCQNGGSCAAGNQCVCTPDFEGNRCENVLLECKPSCKNGGICERGNKCVCSPEFEGDRCENEKRLQNCCEGWTEYFNTDNPIFSDTGDDESLDRIREFQPVCSEGIISDIECKVIKNGRLIDYKEVETVGLKCSKDTGFTCNKEERGSCEDFAVRFLCECPECNPPCQNGGKCDKENECICTPDFEGDRCENVVLACEPSCKNGGICEAGNKCLCTPEFEGDRCENEIHSGGCVDGWTEYLNTDFPKFSDIGDDESLDRIRELHPICIGGIIKDIECKAIVNGKFIDYKERGIVGLKCSKDTGFTCDKKVRGKCEDFAVRFFCGCDVNVNEGPPSSQLQICPEVPSHILNQCPLSCPPGFACFEYACVPRENCPCFRNGTNFTPTKSVWITEKCEKCECQIGGNSKCESIKCPGCLPGQRSVMDSTCRCICINCPGNAVFCPEKSKCYEKELFCNGSVQCPGIQVTCPTVPPTPELLQDIKPMNCSTDRQSETDTCEILGNVVETFDGHTYQYDTCSHVLMKEQFFESFSVTVHKICSSKTPVKCHRHLIISVDGLVITFGPGIDTVTVKNTKVPLRSLWLVSQKFSHIELKENGNTLVFRTLKYNFDVTWDKLDNAKIKVSKCLMNRIVGLCGLYDRKLEDDMKMPNGIVANTGQEFGNSWAIGSLETCSQPNYTVKISSKANVTCSKLRDQPFKSCYKSSDLNRKVEACFSFMRECIQRSVKSETGSLDESEYEKCKCFAFENFAEDCENFKKRPAEEWRILHGCVPTCSHGMEWNNCGPGCQLTCDNYHQRYKICTSTCVPGCYCPPGLVRHQNQCVKPKMCHDCICRGYGDPNYITFDGRFYNFQGICSYVLAQHLASDDNTMIFRILGTNTFCLEEPKTTCLLSLKIIWNGHMIQKQKFQQVLLDRKFIKPEESPYDKDGISITYVPHNYTLIHIKKINLVVRYFDRMQGFSIELPSFYYYNKTEGLCGVCNFNPSDDLYHQDGYVTNNTEDFAYSWLIGRRRQFCELQRIGAIEHPPGICNFTSNPCEAILDPSPFLKSCQEYVQYSRGPEISICRSKFQYAQQCCERGVLLDEWLKHSGCDSSCSPGMVYKCTSSCPKTCENYKTYREDDCLIMPQNVCVCPEGEVLKFGRCVKTIACEVCDKSGHTIGDVWKVEPCKTCECLPDLTTKCTVHQCLEPPVCSEQETILKVEGSNDTCCDSYKCVPKSQISGCEEPKLEACPPGKALVLKQTDLCPIYQCECFPQLCPPNVSPLLDDGESFHLVATDCCPEVQITCDPNLCAPSPNCSQGFKLSIDKGRCCLKQKCVPLEDICVYEHQYEVVNGFQMKLPLERYYEKEYQPGSSWHDGLCRECTCVDIKGHLMSRCKLELCQNLGNFPDSEKYIRTEVHVKGSCCPKYVRKLCVDQGINYKIGDEWSSAENNLCRKVSRCVLDNAGEAVINVTSKCETPCNT